MRPDPRYRWRLAALSLVMLLPSLGTSIANVALPSLATAFSVPFDAVQWVVLSYLLAVTTLIVGAGHLGDHLGRRRLLLIGIGLFALASAACAIAPNLWALVAARALQGAGAALMMSLTVALVSETVPKDRTGRAIGLLGTVSAVGTALGPSVGGALISWSGWPVVFLLLTAASILALLASYRALPPDAPIERDGFSFDLAGTGLLALTLGCYALSATLRGPDGSINLVLIGVALFALAAWIIVEARAKRPLVQVELLRDGELAPALIALGLVSTIVMATLVVGPFYLAQALGLSPAATGLVMSVGPVVAAIMGTPAGRLVDRLGTDAVTVWGLLTTLAGCVSMVVLPGLLGTGGYVGALALITAGYGLFQAANNTAIMTRAPAGRRGVISALLGLSRNLGLITGASVMGAVFALGTRGLGALGLGAGAQSGLQVTFAVAATLACVALGLSGWRYRRRRHATG